MNFLRQVALPATLTTVTAICGFSTGAVAFTFTVKQNFTGITRTDVRNLNDGRGFVPPDTIGAVGTDHIVEFTNGAFSIYSKNGTSLRMLSDSQFWTDIAGVDLTAGLSDPRVLYDTASGRWFAAEIDIPTDADDNLISNNFLLAVSDSSDPTAGWKGFRIDADSTDAVFTDYPTLGLNADGVYLASNNFNLFDDPDDTVLGVTLVSIPKGDLLASTPTVSNRTVFENLDARKYGFTLQPAVDFGPSTDRAPILATGCSGLDCGEFSTQFYNALFRADVLNTETSFATVSSPVGIGVDSYSHPPFAEQPDGSVEIDGGDTRINSTVFKVGNSLWAANATELNGRVAVRWYEIDAATNEVLQSGTIGDPDHDYYYPSIAVNEFGNVVVGFSRSGLTEFISSYAVVGYTLDGVTTFGTPTLLKAGIDNYHVIGGEGERWGDYSATVVDPTNPLNFWTFQEFAAGKDDRGRDVWGTQVTRIRINRDVPEPSFAASLVALGGVGTVLRLKSKRS